MPRVVSFWLPAWPTERLRRHRAGLPVDEPLVNRHHDGRRMVIAAACPAVQALGLRAGLSLAHAQAMVPGLLVHDATPVEDARALERLSPLTAADPPDGAWIDATGCTDLLGGEPAMLLLLVEHLARQGLTGRVAIADTPGAVHALARFGGSLVTIVEVGASATADALALLPVAALRVDAATVDALRVTARHCPV